MQCMHQLRVCCEACLIRSKICCEACLSKSKEMITRMIVRMNNARGGGERGFDDGSMLDGLLMSSDR